MTWLGEPWDPQLTHDIALVAPNAGRWGLYGSTETWVVGTNWPECSSDTWHPVPSQLIHIGDGRDARLHLVQARWAKSGAPVPDRRRGLFRDLSVRPAGKALRVLGRRDGVVKFRGFLLSVDDIVAELAAQPGVSRAQLLITEHADAGTSLDVLVLRDPGRESRSTGPDCAGTSSDPRLA